MHGFCYHVGPIWVQKAIYISLTCQAQSTRGLSRRCFSTPPSPSSNLRCGHLQREKHATWKIPKTAGGPFCFLLKVERIGDGMDDRAIKVGAVQIPAVLLKPCRGDHDKSGFKATTTAGINSPKRRSPCLPRASGFRQTARNKLLLEEKKAALMREARSGGRLGERPRSGWELSLVFVDFFGLSLLDFLSWTQR